jgi:cytochrome P450
MPEERRVPPEVQTIARPPGPPVRRASALARARYALNFLFDPIGFVGGRFAQFGDIYYVGSSGDAPGLYVLRHPDHIEEVLITHAKVMRKEHSGFAHLSRVLGDGLLTTDGDDWRRQRRIVTPAFSRARLEGYAAEMADEARLESERWKDGQTIDASVAMTEMTLRIVCRTLFGHDASSDTEPVRHAMAAFQSSLLALELPLPKWASPLEWRLSRANAALDAIIYRMIAARRAKGPAGDLLSMLLDAKDVEGDGKGLSEREIRDQLVTLFLAGHETTANALAWTFYLLSQNPEVEARLHDEVDRVLGGRPAAFEDLARLPYTEQVFLEAMRLYPPVYMLARKTAEDVTIGGWPIPKGSELVLWIWHTHHDPRFWEEPWAFRPERFEKARAAERPKPAFAQHAPIGGRASAEREPAGEAPRRMAYAPFGAGPRACIGKTFALMEGQLALATLAARHRLELVPGHPVELRPRITLAPAHGLPMIVRRRA